LIAYAIETALNSTLINRVVVSTDDEEIAAVARQYGSEVPFMRPEALARDDSPEWLTWQHAIQTLADLDGESNIDVLAVILPTSPLRAVADIDACITKLIETDADIVITVKSAERNPYFNMVTIDDEGHTQLVIPSQGTVFRRQDAPPVYDVTTVVVAARPQFVMSATSLFEGKVKAVVVPAERALDIDTELDFRVAELFLGQMSGKFG
jgi:N-acylneuraminate cytidylyltransferase